MGTRINGLLDHDLTDSRDRGSVLARLATVLPAALAVRDYWQSADPNSPRGDPMVWRADPVSPREPCLHRYAGPGSLFLTVTAQAASLRTGGRWRGFLSVQPLRRVHLMAFRQIADSLGARSLALHADSCDVDDLFWGGRSAGECIELMERMWGPPLRSVEDIERRVAAAAEHSVPTVWFLESRQIGAE